MKIDYVAPRCRVIEIGLGDLFQDIVPFSYSSNESEDAEFDVKQQSSSADSPWDDEW